MKKVLVLFVMALAINVSAQESVLLRLNYTKGDVYLMDMKMSQDMGTVMSMDMGMKMSQEIMSVTGDTYVSNMKIQHISMDMSQGGMNVSYDSSKSDDELDATAKMMKGQMAPMLSATIISKGNNLGDVLDIKVEPNIPNANDFAKQSGNVVYPKHKIKVGDTWTATKNEKGMNLNFVYTVKSITSTQVLLGITGQISGSAEGEITGSMDVNKESGVPTNSKINMDMTIQGQEMVSIVTIKMTKQ